VWGFLPPGVRPGKKKNIVISIKGLENSIAAELEPNAFWHRVNYARDSFPKRILFPMVLWLMEGTFNKILMEANDFWSRRSGTFYFSEPPGANQRLI